MTRVTRRVALLLAVLLVILGAAPADAQTVASRKRRQAEIRQRIDRLRDQVEEASEAEADLLRRLDEVDDRKLALDAQVATLDREIARVEAELAAANERLEAVTAEVVRAQDRVLQARAELRRAKKALQQRAVAAYVGNPTANAAADLMLHTTSMRDLSAKVGYYQAIVEAQRVAVDRYSALREEAEELEAAAERTRDEVREQRQIVANHHENLRGKRAEQDFLRSRVAEEQRWRQSLLDEVRDRKAEFEVQIAALQRESDSIASFLRSIQSNQGVIVSGKGILAVPIPGARITSRFGPRVHPIFGDVRVHTGIDFGAGTGVPIRAAGDGVVVYAGPRGGYGNAVIIDHGGSLATLYAHQSRLAVRDGDRVRKGAVVGYVGSTGFSTGPHLHFETRVSGTPVDPLRFL